MKALSIEVNREIDSLDPREAAEFRAAIASILRLIRERRAPENRPPFSKRIAGHPAIGTWPAELDADAHVTKLRDEWEK
ncbi:MAG: hypothetical protein KDM91_08310 [Verrucomicrobiae bacterium]|nr:hypothetical protein [Verrucomicrobiae bacterium]MCP5541143.1 hypothetical protein [Akkermansiaceae bacterium]MCP5551264.1 hypothetical protein [Akkermansiaceae bacterium]